MSEKLFPDEVEGVYITPIASEDTKKLVIQNLLTKEGKLYTSFKIISDGNITDFETFSLFNALEVYNSI